MLLRYTIKNSVIWNKPTKVGYTFKGWYTDKDFTTKVSGIKKGSTGNREIYAKWTENQYHVTFHKNGSKAKGSALKLKNISYSNSITLPENPYGERKGYVFTGWNTKANKKGIHYDAG